MELDELKPTGYFSEFSWISDEDEEEETAAVLDGTDVFASRLQDELVVAGTAKVPVLEKQGADPS